MQPQTEADQFVFAQVYPLLQPGEQIVCCAYLTPATGPLEWYVVTASKTAAFAALTNQRLLLIQTRFGAFKPLLENHGVVSLAYPEINGVIVRASLMIEQRNGQVLQYQVNTLSKAISTQKAFFQQIGSTFRPTEALAKRSRTNIRVTLITGIVGLALAALYLWAKLR
jgi:hypothetical protein